VSPVWKSWRSTGSTIARAACSQVGLGSQARRRLFGGANVIASGNEPMSWSGSRGGSHRHPALRANDTACRAQAVARRPPPGCRTPRPRRGGGQALRSGGKRPPAVGVKERGGRIPSAGAVVACLSPEGARSRVDWSTTTRRNPGALPPGVKRDRGHTGYIDVAELIHRDNLVLL